MFFDVVVHQVVENQVVLEIMMVEQHIFVHQIYVMESVQKMHLLMEQVNHFIDRYKYNYVKLLVTTPTAVSSTRTATTVTTTRTTTAQTSFSCYECSASNEQPCTATMSNCPMCMVYRSDSDPSI